MQALISLAFLCSSDKCVSPVLVQVDVASGSEMNCDCERGETGQETTDYSPIEAIYWMLFKILEEGRIAEYLRSLLTGLEMYA